MKPIFNDHEHLYLTGYRGCGKSTVAKVLAETLNRPLVDLDERIESDAEMTIAEIFQRETESGFRRRETSCLKTVSRDPPRVISLGGGAILSDENRRTIAATGWCVWLDADPSVIADRLAGDATTRDRRPSLTGRPVLQEIREVMSAREPLYRDVSDLRIDTSEQSVREIVDQILAAAVPRHGE